MAVLRSDERHLSPLPMTRFPYSQRPVAELNF